MSADASTPGVPDPDVGSPDAESALSTLTRAVQELSLAETLEDVAIIVRSAARHLVGADGATFVLRDADRCVYVDEDAIEPLWKGQHFPLEFCISGWAMLHREPVVIEDIYRDARVPHDAYRPTFVHSLVMTPIRTLDPIGAIGMYWADTHRATPREIGLARALADSTAVALESVLRRGQLANAQREATTDALTGVPNRRAWQVALRTAMVAHPDNLQVLLIDLDHFKAFNDANGHPAGDRLLQRSAAAWSIGLRQGDLLARVGGEEFGAVLVHCTAAAALGVADRIRASIPEHQTASIGIATWDGNESAEGLLERADQALYAAKSRGRDRAVLVGRGDLSTR